MGFVKNDGINSRKNILGLKITSGVKDTREYFISGDKTLVAHGF